MPDWDQVLNFWFPEGTRPDIDPAAHAWNWLWRMRGGADAAIVERFTDLTEEAVAGAYDHWAEDAHGRLALIIAVDQFPRSVWRDTPRAFATDAKALALTLDGYQNGHYGRLETPWFKTMFNLPLVHCEGPDHLARLDRSVQLAFEILEGAPAGLKANYQFVAETGAEARKVIATFGRHPHRNATLGRTSTPEEEAYLKEGRFPHTREIPNFRDLRQSPTAP